MFFAKSDGGVDYQKRMQRRKTDERQHAKRRNLQNSNADLQNVGVAETLDSGDRLMKLQSYTVCGE